MHNNVLVKMLSNLSQGSKQSVQSGDPGDAYSNYMHTPRPIEDVVRREMNELREMGGGVLFLVGNAGDGKSLLISTLKQDYQDFLYHNDASESLSPKLSAIETLKRHLKGMADDNIDKTTQKIVVNINLGKLSEFIDDSESQQQFGRIVKCAKTLFDEDELNHDQDRRIRIVFFGYYQIFDIIPDKQSGALPVDSPFIECLIEKVTQPTDDNPFYKAFQESRKLDVYDPVVINYQLLSLPSVRKSIVQIIIEAIVRYKLTVTVRELLDLIYRLLVPVDLKTFEVNKDFFRTLLPTTLFSGGANRILKVISALDPLKQGSIEHNRALSCLFTCTQLPKNGDFRILQDTLDTSFFDYLDCFYKNNGKNIDDISILLFRLKHLLDYHSESDEYRDFLNYLCWYHTGDLENLYPLYKLILECIPRYMGAYTNKSKIAPLNIQGTRFKLFTSCEQLKIDSNQKIITFDDKAKNRILTNIETHWTMSGVKLKLKVDYPLYTQLCCIHKGRLTLYTERNQNLAFSEFLNDVVKHSDNANELTILAPENSTYRLERILQDRVVLS